MEAPVPRAALLASLRPLLDEDSLADALAWYYAFQHPEPRTLLFVHTPPGASGVGGQTDGFLVRAQTGQDLFRPLVTYRARHEAAAAELFQAGMPAGRPVYFTVPAGLAGWANKHLAITDAELHRIYHLPARLHAPEVNVLVLNSRSPDGTPRCEIRSSDRAAAVAGVNWQSARFAEIYVYTDPAARGRGWAKSVVRALAGLVLQAGRTPLYVVAETNQVSAHVAEAVGFQDTGLREYVCQAIRPA